jgi:serine/threonine protein kinase/tetratricopeptide (TPR) repeat protein
MPLDPQRVQSLFLAAVEAGTPAARAALLGQECGTDAELRRRVEALLRAHDASDSFPDEPSRVLAATVDDPIRERPGAVIGPYKLMEQIGEGGMGLVFVAEQQQPVRRKVALKVIKPGMDTRHVIARFEAERQALALMDHPNIAKVLDGGTTDSRRPYFVMELVKGVPITDYCDQNQVPIRQRLELFVSVGQAVQHAHQKGIIHRDLKPSNVLVVSHDGTPVVKVIDFGVAKAIGQQLTDKTIYTQFSQMVGTPLYMSPEQAGQSGLDVDTRSDIYSLGVLLYELLTGTTPFDHERMHELGYDEMRRIIREEEPPKPSTRISTMGKAAMTVSTQRQSEPKQLSRLIRGELDWIVMKALEKDRNRRYETANFFAMDVQRYLADEPVLACPPSAGYRLHKLIRRNKGPIVAASLVLFSMLAGTLASIWLAVRADQERRIAQSREAETKAVLDFLEKKVLAAARPEGQAGGLGHDVTLRQAIEAALPFIETSFKDQPLIEARLRHTLAVSFGNLGEAKIAADQAERAWTLYSQHLGADHPDTLASMHNLAMCYDGLGRQADALKLYEETLVLMKAKLGLDDPRTLSTMNELALSYAALGRQADALKLHEETLTLKKARLGPDHPSTLGSMNNLALTYTALGRHADALKLAQETVALTKAKLGTQHRTTLDSMYSLAHIYHAGGQHREAVKLYEETLALRKAKIGPKHPTTLSTMHDLAGVYVALGRLDEAVKLYEETLALRKAKLGADHPDTLASMDVLARRLATCPNVKVRNPSRAVELAKKAVELDPNEGDYWNTLGVAHYRGGDGKAAVAALEKSMGLRKGGDSLDWYFLAMAHWQLGEKEEARKWYDRAVEWMQKNKPNDEALRRFHAEAAELLSMKQ